MDSLGVIADEEVNTDADVKVGMDADVADDNLHWMEDGPARTKCLKEPELEIFKSGTSLQAVLEPAEKPDCMFQRQRFLRKLQVARLVMNEHYISESRY
ncbi:hypothetical protein F2Q69_00006280 [Brassica cretica]|uniref:Uncharacterized protein n=1 Tax=Brassica cretica TaxID=69181 RepID=A0A8S9NR38_BRACR|nr:hypothetical protein F2Q69_00006280 [Brassica cretica]